jgi:hypothetical protein
VLWRLGERNRVGGSPESSTSVVAACTRQSWLPRRLVDDHTVGVTHDLAKPETSFRARGILGRVYYYLTF